MSSPSAVNAAKALPSPPGATTPEISDAPHTPRRALAGLGSNVRSSRAHLLSPDESPSYRRSKRARLSKEPTPVPNWGPGSKRVQQYRPPPPSLQYHALMKSLYGFHYHALGRSAFHCGDWAAPLLKFYSRPKDEHPTLLNGYGAECLPISTAACRRNSLVAIGDEMGHVRLVESGKDEEPGFTKEFLNFQCHDNAIFDMSWSLDDLQLATASGDQSCRVFDITKQVALYHLVQHRNTVKQVAYNPHNQFLLASSARDGTLNIWDLRVAGTKISEGSNVVAALQPVDCIRGIHTPEDRKAAKPSSVTALVWVDEHRVATTCEHDAEIKLWDLRSHLFRKKTPQEAESSGLPPNQVRSYGMSSLSISPDGQRMYALCKNSYIYAYSTNHLSKGPIHAYSHRRLNVDSFYVKCEVSRDGKYIAAGSSSNVGVVFPIEEQYLNHRMSADFTHQSRDNYLAGHLKVGKGVVLVHGHDSEVTDVTWTINHDLITVSDNFRMRCWRQDGDGSEAEDLRDGGETGGRRWGKGWAQRD